MKKIRTGVFETNSSSTHSISIANTDSGKLMEIVVPNDEGNIVLYGGEFGWEYNKYYDALNKASYMAIYAVDWCGERSDEFVQILKDVIKEQTGCKDVIFAFSSDYDSCHWSYIDHQSVENQEYHYLFEDSELLRQFIFNPNSYLITDNDNH